MMKKFETLATLLIFMLFINGCATAKKAFSPERKNSSEEFLVEKKSPLALPPDFDKLPTPKNSIIKVDQNDDIEKLILNQKNTQDIINSSNENLALEESIIEQINKN